MTKKLQLFICPVLLVIIFFLGFLVERSGVLKQVFCDKSELKYINQKLICGDKFIVSKQAYLTLKEKIVSFIEAEKQAGNLEIASVYFRDLDYGPTMGINEYEAFAPASLLKVPLMITYLQLEEDDSGILDKKLRYFKQGSSTFSQLIPPSQSIQEDTPYAIKELLKYMIAYSDNNAYNVLVKYLQQYNPNVDLALQTVNDLGIITPGDTTYQTITVKSYASIYTQLYHSSFFAEKQTSELALELLAESDFNKGLVAGLPAGIAVAHKFGEREFVDNNVKQLHDCGIVYYPGNPYLLCVMTRGNDLNKLAEIISAISHMVYEEFDSRRL